MRIRRLALERYGHFRDFALEFGSPPDRGADLHIVYGPNEAGKSTVLAAWLDFLFGAPHQSPYAFRHGAELAVAAELDLAAGPFAARRRKTRTASLVDLAEARPAPDGPLAAALGGLGRSAYGAMFCLDEASLARGGEDILSMQGDLGAILFSGVSGLGAVGAALADAEAEADALFVVRGKKQELPQLIAKRQALLERAAARDVDAAARAELADALERAETARRAAEARRLTARAALDEARRLAAAARIWARIDQIETDLAPLAAAPDAPDDALARARDLTETARRAQLRAAEAERRVAEASAALDNAPEDAPALAEAGAIEALAGLKGAASAAAATLKPARRAAEAAEAEAARRGGALAALWPDGAPNVAAAARLRALIDAYEPLARADAAARAEHDRAHSAYARLARTDAETPNLSDLDAEIAADAERAAERRARRAAAEAAAAHAAEQTLGGSGDAAASGAEAETLRRARDAAWAAHRAQLDAASADVFKAALDADDAADAVRRAAASAEERRRAAQKAAAHAKAAAEQAEAAAARVEADMEAADARRAAILARLDAPADWSWTALRAFASERAAAAAELGRRRDAWAAAEAALARWRAEWSAALSETGLAAAAPSAARAALDASDAVSALEARRAESRARLADAESAVAAFEGAVAALDPLAPTLAEAPAAARAAALAERLAAARATAARRDALLRRRDGEIARREEAARDAAAAQAALAPMMAAAGAADAETLVDALVRAETRRRLRADLRDAEDALLAALGAPDLAAARALAEARLGESAEGADQARLTQAIISCEEAFAAAEAAVAERAAEAAAARRALDAVVGDEQAARLIGAAEAVAEEIRVAARRHLKLKLGAAALRAALDRFRRAQRSAMMEEAGALFAALTGGLYTGLASTLGRRGRAALVVEDADGAARAPSDLSTGARAQLYLALRIAGFRAFHEGREPLPFIADDIIETFDDARAAAAFRALLDLSRRTQVIYLTHHRHLCAIAQEVAAAEGAARVAVHALPPAERWRERVTAPRVRSEDAS